MMTDQEIQDLSKQLVQAVANSSQHIIHADDPVMTLVIMLQIIASNTQNEQQRLLDDYTSSILVGTARILTAAEASGQKLLEAVRADLQRQFDSGIRTAMLAGGEGLKTLLRSEFDKSLATLRIENKTVKDAKTISQVALATAVLSFLGITALILAGWPHSM